MYTVILIRPKLKHLNAGHGETDPGTLRQKLKSNNETEPPWVADDLLVTLPNGQIRGHQLQTSTNKSYYAFQGIPYAAPPLGKLRFQAPVSAENWDGVFDATKDGNDCINKIGTKESVLPESEDCLIINVYSPKLNTNASNVDLLPVMFWIYGGGFVGGTSCKENFGPDYFIEEDIVLVSFNYRLGAFGFISTLDDIIPGNAGLKDQNFALKWTNENIHLFGGDKDKITIFGESAGSASVAYHLLSEKSAGLFRAAIGESGSPLCRWALNRNPITYLYELIEQIAKENYITLDDNVSSSEGALAFLANQTATAIQNAEAIFTDLLAGIGTPILESPLGRDSFITESSYQQLESGKANRVPLLMGFNSEEFLYWDRTGDTTYLANMATSFDEYPEGLIPSDLAPEDLATKPEIEDEIKKFYLENNTSFLDNLGAVVVYGTDVYFTNAILKHAELQSKFSDVYFYQFAYHGTLGSVWNNSTVKGTLGNVEHTEEMLYLFKIFGLDINLFPEQGILTQKRLVKMWTNFAKHMNPTPETSELLQNITWPVVGKYNFQYLNISENLEIVQGYPRAINYDEWNTTYHKWGEKPFITF